MRTRTSLLAGPTRPGCATCSVGTDIDPGGEARYR